jgi:RND family efflux transporter MFP subunit
MTIKTIPNIFYPYFIKWITGVTLMFLLSACDNSVDISKQPIRTVRVETVSANNTLLQRRFVGRIDAVSTVDLSFQVPGRMIELPAQEGLLIPKGQLIAALDRHDYQLAVEQSEAQYKLAKLDVIRKRNLFKSGSLPKAMLDQAETKFTVSQVALKTAKRNLTYTRIVAPFDALVSQRLIDNYTNVGAYQPIVRVQDLTELRVRINIPEQMVKLLEKTEDFKAVAIFKDRPKQQFPLSYREHITEAGSVAQTFEVVFGLAREKNEYVLPGMTVAVIISKKEGPEAPKFAIPVSAIDYDAQGKPRVWIFDEQSKTATSKSVILGTIKKRKIPVLSGLQGGEQIVTAGAHLLREGMTVRRFVSF